MKFRDALNQTIIEPMKKFEDQILERVAYKQLDACLEKDCRNYKEISEKIMQDTLKISEIFQVRPERYECETDYMNKSHLSGIYCRELREIGLLNFLKKHPEYRERLFPSTNSNILKKKIHQYLQKELN